MIAARPPGGDCDSLAVFCVVAVPAPCVPSACPLGRYGSTYDQYAICRYEGYDDEACNTASDLELYGPNTLSISVAYQSLDFFDRIGAGIVEKQRRQQQQQLL